MPEFGDNPLLLTKEQLKNKLLANNVQLPSGEQRKDVYVQLYKQHFTDRNTTDFSSEEERESTPVRGRGRPPGRKATKKTDKPSVEEKTEQDVTELSNEALKEELLKYGMTAGPIQGTTRKVYEKRLIKLKEQVTSITSVSDSTIEDNKQNGNRDSSQYSDNEESKIELTFETREPIRGKAKGQVTARSRRLEQAESTSGDVLSEPLKILEPEQVGRALAISNESRVVRRTPRKRVVAAEPQPDDDGDADISETSPVTETILASSNQALVDNQVTETFKHTNALRSVSGFSELARRTPKKQLISEKILERPFIEEKREYRDVLKEMFPYDVKTPTGISATCRRPIKGASGRPLSLQDLNIGESYTSNYVSRYQPVLEEKTTNQKSGRSMPMWIKILISVVLAVFAFLVYQVMETNEGNPFAIFLQGSNLSQAKN